MFTVKDKKTTKRTVGCISNGLVMLLSAAAALFLSGMIVISFFFPGMEMQKMKFAFIIIVLLSLEAVGSYYTFHPDVSDGPNSALLNLPLLTVDIIIGLFIIGMIQVSSPGILPILVRRIRLLAITLATLRYLGLAWTDRDCCLKKYIAPVRADKQLVFKPMAV